MALLSLVAVAALFVFLALRSRKNPLFLAGGAAFLGLGRSAFIDIIPDQAALSLPMVSTGDLIFAALVLGWVYSRGRRPVPRIRLSLRWIVLGVLLTLFLVLELALALASAAELHPTVIVMSRDWLYIPLGYLMMVDTLRRFLTCEVVEYVGTLSLFTTCLTVLYVASALTIPIYPYAKFLIVSFHGATIIRDFTTFPIWLGLAWGYYLSRTKKNTWTFAALMVLAFGTMLTYTRSTIITLATLTVLAAVLLLVRRGRRRATLVVGAAFAVLTLVVVVVAPILVPAQLAYVQSRFVGLERSRDVLSDPNALFRIGRFGAARIAGARVDSLLGAGLVDASSAERGEQYDSYDSDWIRIVYRTGLVGVVLFGAVLATALVWGIASYLGHASSIEDRALLLTAILATAFGAMGRFAGLVYFWWPALSLLPVALMAYAVGRPERARSVDTDLSASSSNLDSSRGPK